MRLGHALSFASALILPVLLPACSGLTPLGPTPLDEGIIVYIHSGFQGPSQAIGIDVPDLGKVEGPCHEGDGESAPTWNDCISSVRVLPGWGATLYGDSGFRGAMLELAADIQDLKGVHGPCSGSYNDCISSVRVYHK